MCLKSMTLPLTVSNSIWLSSHCHTCSMESPDWVGLFCLQPCFWHGTRAYRTGPELLMHAFWPLQVARTFSLISRKTQIIMLKEIQELNCRDNNIEPHFSLFWSADKTYLHDIRFPKYNVKSLKRVYNVKSVEVLDHFYFKPLLGKNLRNEYRD